MVSNAYYDWRTPSIADVNQYKLLCSLKDSGITDIKIFEMGVYQEAPDTEAEIRESYTNELNAVTTAVKLDIKSSDAKDTSNGVGARTVKLFGIGASTAAGTQDYLEETITLNGTTVVTTTNYWGRVMMLKVLTAGSEGDPAGNITIHENGGTTNTYLTLAAGKLCSVNTRFYVHTGYKCNLIQMNGSIIQPTGSSAAAVDAGTTIRPMFIDTSLGLSDIPNHSYSILPGRYWVMPYHWGVITGSPTKYFTVKHATINTNTNKDTHYDIFLMLWK